MPDRLQPFASDVNSDLPAQAAELRGLIDSGTRGRARALADFARDHGRDPELVDEAVLLGLDSARPEAESRARMHELLERVLVGSSVAGGAPHAQAGEELLGRWLEERERPRGLAFDGRGLTKRYGEQGFCLEPVDLKLALGEVTGVVGQNAQGKTTLLRIVAGELSPDGGALAYPALGQAGPRIDWVALKKQVAFVPQDLPRWRGGLGDTLYFEAAMHGIRPADNEREVRFVVERLDLGGHLEKRWDELSGGYRLRFALARALVWKPRLLVLDEPLANLDIKAKEVLLQDVSQLARSFRDPIAVLMSSHELHGLERVCAQMLFLRQGRVEYKGPPDGVPGDTCMYELVTRLSAAELRALLKPHGLLDLRDDGGQYTLRTDAALDAPRLLRLLIDLDVPVKHFRDISRSVRRLFE